MFICAEQSFPASSTEGVKSLSKQEVQSKSVVWLFFLTLFLFPAWLHKVPTVSAVDLVRPRADGSKLKREMQPQATCVSMVSR